MRPIMPFCPRWIRSLSLACAVAFLFLAGTSEWSNAQGSASQADVASLPDEPVAATQQGSSEPKQSSGSQPSQPPQQTSRILGIMPNFSAVSADVHLPPQTPKQKFVIAAKNSFDYSSFLIAGIQSGVSMATESYPEFEQGAAGYGRYYYHTLLDTADANFMVSGLWPVIFRQDNRFYTLGHGGFRKRAFYAMTRVLVTRSDAGNQVFNASEIVGTGAAAGVSTLYYPSRYTTWTKVGQRWLTSCIIDSANYTFKEFWPDINRKLFHTK
jgi:hypothetical protein